MLRHPIILFATLLAILSATQVVQAAEKGELGYACHKSSACNSGLFCNRKKCAPLENAGGPCYKDNGCLSGRCRSNVCLANGNLPNKAVCSKSVQCKSENCSRARCAAKVAAGARCYKDANCMSSATCDTLHKICVANPTPTGTPAFTGTLQPVTNPSAYLSSSGPLSQSNFNSIKTFGDVSVESGSTPFIKFVADGPNSAALTASTASASKRSRLSARQAATNKLSFSYQYTSTGVAGAKCYFQPGANGQMLDTIAKSGSDTASVAASYPIEAPISSISFILVCDSQGAGVLSVSEIRTTTSEAGTTIVQPTFTATTISPTGTLAQPTATGVGEMYMYSLPDSKFTSDPTGIYTFSNTANTPIWDGDATSCGSNNGNGCVDLTPVYTDPDQKPALAITQTASKLIPANSTRESIRNSKRDVTVASSRYQLIVGYLAVLGWTHTDNFDYSDPGIKCTGTVSLTSNKDSSVALQDTFDAYTAAYFVGINSRPYPNYGLYASKSFNITGMPEQYTFSLGFTCGSNLANASIKVNQAALNIMLPSSCDTDC